MGKGLNWNSGTNSASSYNISSYIPNYYNKLKVDNFALTNVYLAHESTNTAAQQIILSYNPSNGVITVGHSGGSNRVIWYCIVAYYIK